MESQIYNSSNGSSFLNGSLKGDFTQNKNTRAKSCSMLNLKTINLDQQYKGLMKKKKILNN